MKINKLTIQIMLLFLLAAIPGCSSLGKGLDKDTISISEPLISFPRLGMWWPDPWEQSLDDIARYDWVLLFPYMEEFIDPIKLINPDILLLTSTNACELGYDPTGDFPEDNIDILAIPPEWFLTQVGTVLTREVNATSTIFHIENMSIADGEDVYQLFIPGDTVLIDGESILVESVDKGSKTLTVQRGYIRPASAHKAGTRIAAHITFWPDSWLLNLSTMSPSAIINTKNGQERWADYNARTAAELLSNPSWDGILLDRADPNQSWLIGGSTARTIDPDQSNTLITDYSSFDKSWNEGLREFEIRLREMIGEKKLILANWGMENYDLLNGNNYEGFPLDNSRSYQEPWRQTVFGSIRDIGSYMDWMEKGQGPNITMIETYEDDGSPDATSNGSYNNPYDDSFFVPNYQKMRFGLTTALLGDGYYSYEINTNGHGTLGLLWFDEYDNAGKGRGYLGLPLNPAYMTGNIQLGKNKLLGNNWDLWTYEGNTASISLDTEINSSKNSSFQIDIVETKGIDWQISVSFVPLDVLENKEYSLSFRAKSDRKRSISAWIMENSDPWENYLDFSDILLTTEWKQFNLVAKASHSDSNAVFQFGIGEKTGTVWLDDVQLQEGNQDIWRRDYEGGIVLVNATNIAGTIDLNGEFQKINGTQAPEINDGSVVTKVEIRPYDGLILLRKYNN